MFNKKRNYFELNDILSLRQKVIDMRQEFLETSIKKIENIENNALKESKQNHLQTNSFFDFDLPKFEIKDSLFFKKFDQKKQTMKPCLTKNTQMFSIEKFNEMFEYKINLSKNFPERKKQTIYEEDFSGICPKNFHNYFSKVFDIYVQNFLKLDPNIVEKNKKEIILDFFQTLEEFRRKLLENVNFNNLKEIKIVSDKSNN